MASILVTGASGYIGQFVVDAALRRGPSVARVAGTCATAPLHDDDGGDSSSAWPCPMYRVRLGDGDPSSDTPSTAASTAPTASTASTASMPSTVSTATTASFAAVRACLEDFRPDVVVHCAAVASLGACEADPAAAMRANADPALLAALRELCPDCALIFASTDQVFDGLGPLPYGPDARSNPVNAYGRSKAAFECAMGAAGDAGNADGAGDAGATDTADGTGRTGENPARLLPGKGTIKGTIVRLSNVYGPRSPFSDPPVGKFVQWLDEQLADDDGSGTSSGGGGGDDDGGEERDCQVKLFSEELRCYVHVEDVADLLVALALEAVEERQEGGDGGGGDGNGDCSDGTSGSNDGGQGGVGAECAHNAGRPRIIHCGGPEALSRVQVGEMVLEARGYRRKAIKMVKSRHHER